MRGARRAGQIVMVHVGDDADDGQPGTSSAAFRPAPAIRSDLSMPEDEARGRLRDQEHRLRRFGVGVRERPAGAQRNPEQLMVVRGDAVALDARILDSCSASCGRSRGSPSSRRCRRTESDPARATALHARNGARSFCDGAVWNASHRAVLGVGLAAKREMRSTRTPPAVKPGSVRDERRDRAQHQAGAGEEHEREREIGDDEHRARRRAAADAAARIDRQRRAARRGAATPRRNEPEDEAGQRWRRAP